LDEKNRLKSVGQLAVVSGWFEQDKSFPKRHSLHLNVSFKEERFGGVPESKIHFEVRLRQCEIVVILPERGNGFRVIQKSLARTPPPPPVSVTDTEDEQQTSKISAMVRISKSLLAGGDVSAEKTTAKHKRTDKSRQVRPMEVLHTLTSEMHHSWLVKGITGALNGSLWDPENEPRFAVSDNRDVGISEKERSLGLPPVSVVEVRCKREDIDIFNMSFKDLETQGIAQNRENHDIRLRAAEEYLKTMIQLQGLRVGDMRDKFSDVSLAEYFIPLFE
jgi:hypothetical protein